MKNLINLFFMAFLCLLCRTIQAQSLPPVNFPQKNICDTTAWKLVLFDDFDGNSLDSTKWITFNSWNGMEQWVNGVYIAGDHENWDEGRCRDPYNAIFRDENIVVSNGTVKILAKNQTSTWQCDTCSSSITKNLTTGTIATPYRKKPNGATNYFNSGKFEFRAKMPLYEDAWCGAYLWHGNGINEIDLVEAYGNKGSYGYTLPWNRPRSTYTTHAWEPEENTPNPNPYNLTHESWGHDYPNQTWWQWLWGKNSDARFTNWHTYTCEWDTSVIRFYIDNELSGTIWKYYSNLIIPFWDNNTNSYIYYSVKIPANCNIYAGDYYITEGFPYNNSANMQLRLGTGFEKTTTGVPNQTFTYGEMEIDYVKVWQRHPEEDGHTDLCDQGAGNQILGPDELCGSTVYSLQNQAPGGFWWPSNNGIILSGGTNGSPVTVTANLNTNVTTTTLRYHIPGNGGCAPNTLYKVINVGADAITAQVSAVRVLNSNATNHYFDLAVSPVIPGANYSWKIWYGTPNGTSNYIIANGPYVTTPTIPTSPNSPYYINWKLTVTTNCHSKVFYSENMNSGLAPIISKPETFMAKDSSAIFLEARLTKEDSLDYEQIVYDKVESQFVEDINDTAAIYEMIGKIRMEALEPYLYFEEENIQEKPGAKQEEPIVNHSNVYPNPTSKQLTIKLSNKFDLHKDVQYKIMDIRGIEHLKGTLNGDLDISSLSSKVYVIELKQGGITEYVKFVKE